MGRKPKSSYIETDALSNSTSYAIPSAEQETNIIFMRGEDFATVCTSDTTMKTKLDKMCENSPEFYSCIDENDYYKTYKIADKTLVSFRQKKKEMSDENKNAASERFKQLHAEGRIGRKKRQKEKD